MNRRRLGGDAVVLVLAAVLLGLADHRLTPAALVVLLAAGWWFAGRLFSTLTRPERTDHDRYRLPYR